MKKAINQIKNILRSVKDFFRKSKASRYLKKNHHYDNSKIKVAFIVQMPEIWNKQQLVYNRMSTDSRFETTLVIVPQFDFQKLKINDSYGDELSFFVKQCKGSRILAIQDGKAIDLSKYHFNYVFYQRPYDYCLPEQLRSSSVTKFSKVCFIPYGMTGTDNYNTSVIYKDFLINASIIFFDTFETQSVAKAKQKRNVEKGLQRFVYLGYPTLDFDQFPDFKNEYKRVLWMPRWGNDGHFFDYNTLFKDMVKNNLDKHFIFRPHPLLKGYLVREKLMTLEEYDGYIYDVCSQGNAELDKNELIESSLPDVDIIITDYTSLFPLFFMTGKAVVYCPSKDDTFNDTFKKLIPGMYFANNENEYDSIIKSLLAGNDKLAEARRLIAKEFYNEHHDSSLRIIDYIAECYKYAN